MTVEPFGPRLHGSQLPPPGTVENPRWGRTNPGGCWRLFISSGNNPSHSLIHYFLCPGAIVRVDYSIMGHFRLRGCEGIRNPWMR